MNFKKFLSSGHRPGKIIVHSQMELKNALFFQSILSVLLELKNWQYCIIFCFVFVLFFFSFLFVFALFLFCFYGFLFLFLVFWGFFFFGFFVCLFFC